MPKLPKTTNLQYIYKLPKLSLQYLKKEVSDKIDFLHADKHESLL